MSPFWHPVSAVYLRDPWSLASPAVVRLVLTGEDGLECVYAGDRMWPALRHGQSVRVLPLSARGPVDGDVVLTQDGNIVDIERIAIRDGALLARGDADPAPARPLDRGQVLGSVAAAPRRRSVPRSLARLWLDLREAMVGAPDGAADPAHTVKQKYDDQAIHYARVEGDPLDLPLRTSLARRLPNAARVLVAGSGTGRETFALESLGYRASGVDFSERMVDAARRAAAARGSSATFTVADLREHGETPASLDAVVFTYDAYSFLPRAAERVDLLERIGHWLRPDGYVFLSARRAQGLRDLAVLTVQRWQHRARPGEWGDSHTRWLDGSGRLHRSFIRVFTPNQLNAEAAAAGFRSVAWQAGHGVFERMTQRRREALA